MDNIYKYYFFNAFIKVWNIFPANNYESMIEKTNKLIVYCKSNHVDVDDLLKKRAWFIGVAGLLYFSLITLSCVLGVMGYEMLSVFVVLMNLVVMGVSIYFKGFYSKKLDESGLNVVL